MMTSRLAMAGVMLAMAVCAAARGEEAAVSTAVPVKSVVLFSSGVGFFEHRGTVTGNASTELRFKTTQINDVLKSLVLQDAGGGVIRNVTYPSQDPLDKTLRSFQIDISANPTLAELLNQLRGARVTATLGDQTVEGTILGVETKERAGAKDNSEKISVSYLNVVTEKGIQSLSLDEIKRVELQDAQLQKELNQALAALAQARDKDKKSVIVKFEGNGDRAVNIGYVVETPVWKTSFRLILPPVDSKDVGKMQGWAIVENQTDNDWTDINLSLVGGRPISFIQNLYSPLYVPRPVVEPKTYASLAPQEYGAGLEQKDVSDELVEEQMDRASNLKRSRSMLARGEIKKALGAGWREAADGAAAPGAMAKEAASLADYSQGVSSVASATKIGEMFHYDVEHVTLARQRSAMIPIVTDGMDFRRVSIYNAGVLARNPLRGVRLKNTSDKYLLSGPVTVLDSVKAGTSYAGDATIDDVPPGQERLLSYAIDQGMLVDATHTNATDDLLTASIVKGVLQLKYRSQISQDYQLDNKDDHEKTVVIEHPVHANYQLLEPKEAKEKTDTLYRFETVVGPKLGGTFKVKEEWVRFNGIEILPQQSETLLWYVNNGAIPQRVRDALNVAVQKKRDLFVLEQRKRQKEQERAQILEEEGNIRENIRALPGNSKTQQDQIVLLGQRDQDLMAVKGDIKEYTSQIEKAQADLNDYVSKLSVE